MRSVIAACFALALLLLAACGGGQKYPPLTAGSIVLAFGDSVTFGTGAGPGDSYPTQLAALSGWKIHNAGIPGDTAEAAQERLPALLDELKPALVIVELGGNDFLRRRDAKAVKEDLRQIVRTARQAGAAVALVGVPEFSLLGAVASRHSDSAIYAELAKEEKILLLADVFSDVLSDAKLKADPIHPNAAGYRQLAESMAKALRKSGLLAKP